MSSSRLDDAVAALQRGEVVGIPTDTVYGLVTLPAFTDRIYEVKGRPRSLELPILISDAIDIDLTTDAARLAARFWPGKLTIVTGGVGYRVPDHDVPRELCRRVGPLPNTSANPHGEPPFATAAEVAALPGVSVVIDGGRCEGAPSTVVRVDPFEIVREGAIPEGELRGVI